MPSVLLFAFGLNIKGSVFCILTFVVTSIRKKTVFLIYFCPLVCYAERENLKGTCFTRKKREFF